MLSSTSAHSNDALARLLATANGALDTDLRAAKSCIQRAAALLGINLSAEGSGAAPYSYLQGGLAPWQAKRIRVYIEEQLGSSIRVADLAEMVQLSTSHFFRAFRKSFGEPPITYIMHRRIRRAQELMVASQAPLSHVALECGLCDQAHLCRCFRRIVGTSPGVWRRQFPVSQATGTSGGRHAAVRTVVGRAPSQRST
jgi:AraC family transcriptional regulator